MENIKLLLIEEQPRSSNTEQEASALPLERVKKGETHDLISKSVKDTRRSMSSLALVLILLW